MLAGALALLTACPAPAAGDSLPSTPGELTKFNIPERNKDGVLVWQLQGDKAKMRPDGRMEIEGLSLNTYRDARVDWNMTTPQCILNRATREAVSEQAVRMVSSSTEITGEGFHWLANESRFIIRTKARVVVQEGISAKMDGKEPSPAKEPSVIRSESLNYDYDKRLAAFEGGVTAEDARFKMTCASMLVHFDPKNNEVIRVDAAGAVRVFHEGREAAGEKGRFTRRTHTVVLSGGKPTLRDEKGNWLISKGDGIIYNLETRQVKVDKPTLQFRMDDEAGGGLMHAANKPGAFPGGKPFTTIESDLLDYDYEKRIATFEGKVTAVDEQLRLSCDRMLVYFDPKSNEVTRVDAFGNVRMFSEDKEALGEKAHFLRDRNTLVLTGNRPKLRDKGGNWVVSTGMGIIYNLETRKMKVDKPVLEVQTTGGLDSGGGKAAPAPAP